MSARPPRRGSLAVRLELGLAALAPALGLIAFRTWGSQLTWLFAVPAAAGVAVLAWGAALVARGKTFPRLALSADAASRPTSHGPYFKANGRRDASLRAGIGTRLVVFNASEHFFKFFHVQSMRLSAIVLPGLDG